MLRSARVIPALSAALLAAALLLPGCRQDSRADLNAERMAMNPARPTTEYAVDFADLKDLLPKAVELAHWAIVHKEIGEDAMCLEALTPADLPVDIRAARIDENRSKVQVKVGLMDHPDMQQQFHDTLQQVIEDSKE